MKFNAQYVTGKIKFLKNRTTTRFTKPLEFRMRRQFQKLFFLLGEDERNFERCGNQKKIGRASCRERVLDGV